MRMWLSIVEETGNREGNKGEETLCAETLNFLSDLFLHAFSYERMFVGNVWNVSFHFFSEPYIAIGTTQSNETEII